VKGVPRQKHVPQRTCVACRQTGAKRGLVRIVRSVSGGVEIDPTGKKNGRGAYLCASRPCWSLALKKRLLEHSLKTTIQPQDSATLEAFSRSLP
jgi:uncharacterized protein